MYSRILVAVDDSKPSEVAMREAVKLAQDQGAKLFILCVVDEYIPVGEGVAVDFKQRDKKALRKGSAILGELAKLVQGKDITHESRLIEIREPHESIPKMIANAALEWEVDLIVMGTHGRTGLVRLLQGSVAEEVVRNSTIPVHIVRDE